MRLTLVIHSLSSGGAERVMTTLANAWVNRGWEITLLTFVDGKVNPFYPLDSRIRRQSLGIESASTGALSATIANVGRVRTIRRAIADSHPDVVISFLDTVNVRVLLSLVGLDIPVIVREANDPATRNIGRSWTILRRLLYPRASRVVVLSEEAKSYFPNSIQKKSAIIVNAMKVNRDDKTSLSANSPTRTAIAMGRLVEQKGFDMLLDAFSRVAAGHPDWRLVVWGEGHLRSELVVQRDRLGLTKLVTFPGRTAEPFREFAKADLFLMSSREEGFPNALGEAMACGLPAVSFDCPSGPRQIIRSEVDGLLVENGNVAAFAAGMERLMRDDQERTKFAARAVEVSERFSTERILGEWEQLIEDVLDEHSRPGVIPLFGRIFRPN